MWVLLPHKLLTLGLALGCSCGGLVVMMLAFYSDNPSFKPAEVYVLYSVNVFENIEKEAGDCTFKKTI